MMILAGIDIGAGNNSGLAIYETGTKLFLNTFSGSVFEVLDELYLWADKHKGKICVVVEDNQLEKDVFNVFDNFWDNVLCPFFYKRIGSRILVKREFQKILAKAQAVGKNKYLCKIFIQELERREIPHIRISPSKRERADKHKKRAGLTLTGDNIKYYNMPTKTTAKQFEELTGYSYQTNEHVRDAATLVYNKTLANLVLQSGKIFNMKDLMRIK